MTLQIQPWRRLVGIGLFLTLAGCDAGLKMGDTWLIQPKPPLAASRMVVQRYAADHRTGPRVDQQTLEVDVLNGRTVLTDTTGRQWPGQLTTQAADSLRQGLADRSWQIGDRRSSAGQSSATYYELTVFEGSVPVKKTAAWAQPSNKPLPDSLSRIVDTFDYLDRMAHPLSERINLLP